MLLIFAMVVTCFTVTATAAEDKMINGVRYTVVTTDKELALMAKTGFNSIRIILEYIVWKEQHDGFMERFDRYLAPNLGGRSS